MAGMKTLVGGEITGYTEMLNEARQIAVKRMVDEAEALGADAIINIRYGSSSVMQGAAEVSRLRHRRPLHAFLKESFSKELPAKLRFAPLILPLSLKESLAKNFPRNFVLPR